MPRGGGIGRGAGSGFSLGKGVYDIYENTKAARELVIRNQAFGIIEDTPTQSMNLGQQALWFRHVQNAAYEYVDFTEVEEWDASEMADEMTSSHDAADQALSDTINSVAVKVTRLAAGVSDEIDI